MRCSTSSINPPLIFTMQLIWESNAENGGEIRATMDAVQEVGCLHITTWQCPVQRSCQGWHARAHTLLASPGPLVCPSQSAELPLATMAVLHGVQEVDSQAPPATPQLLCPLDLCSAALVRPTPLHMGCDLGAAFKQVEGSTAVLPAQGCADPSLADWVRWPCYVQSGACCPLSCKRC